MPPRPHRIRPLLIIAVALLGGLCTGSPAQGAQREPVILVHGWNGSPTEFTQMRTALEQAGYPTYAIDLPGEENLANAQAIADLVEQARSEHAGSKVSLVGHSMGGLSARHYLKFLGGAGKTLSYISMGTSQLGYWPACLLPAGQGGQMCPTSGFIGRLNSGDPTPDPVRYTLLTSSLDETRNDVIAGVWCRAEFAGVPHADEPTSPVFIDAVLSALDGRCPS
ncbi:esterase/lipase family protein [Nonomuraea aurantiaca]|uniref:esterase/lipase family protein n=1 Tax=Nonomuraea aurantiaca TaxID=2878562 RepID=UPI001CD9723B|nr:alpha/beta fold hydrolase [Nonomuraea aurantiaca]MCA2223604.1 alpha/beta fold hydrolase [Nonomuraea aurantiaca]